MHLDRRNFLRRAAAAAVAALTPSVVLAEDDVKIPTRVLGRTGAAVTVLGYGAMQCADAAAIRHGVDQGIGYIDTADCYMGGRNEQIVGRAIEGVRDRVFLATKVHIASEARMRASVERSLSSLKTDRIDLMQIHGVTSAREVENSEAQGALDRMRQEGKIRFVGVTTHGNQEDVLRSIMADGFYDAVLVAVNFRSPQSLFDRIAEAAAKGVGIIAMKTQNGGFRGGPRPDMTPHQAALRYVLEKEGVVTAVPGMLSKGMVDDNLGALRGGAGGLAGLISLEVYRQDLEGRACSFCSQCISRCPKGVGGLDAVRIASYVEGYGDARLALERAAEVSSSLASCLDCLECPVLCSQGIDIRAAAGVAVRSMA